MHPVHQDRNGKTSFIILGLFVIGTLMFVMSRSPSGVAPPPAAAESRTNEAPPSAPAYVNNPEKSAEHADQLAQKSGGDISRLSDDDRRWLDASTAGHATEFVQKRSEALKKHPSAAEPTTDPKTQYKKP